MQGRALTMLVFAAGLIIGIALALVIVGLLAVGAYDRGFEDALDRKAPWRAELKARRAASMRSFLERRAS